MFVGDARIPVIRQTRRRLMTADGAKLRRRNLARDGCDVHDGITYQTTDPRFQPTNRKDTR